jgi:hypothetical protein
MGCTWGVRIWAGKNIIRHTIRSKFVTSSDIYVTLADHCTLSCGRCLQSVSNGQHIFPTNIWTSGTSSIPQPPSCSKMCVASFRYSGHPVRSRHRPLRLSLRSVHSRLAFVISQATDRLRAASSTRHVSRGAIDQLLITGKKTSCLGLGNTFCRASVQTYFAYENASGRTCWFCLVACDTTR